VEYVSFKLYQDNPVWGFVCSENLLEYGGYVNRRPEFLKDVLNLVGMPEIVDRWEERTSTYGYKCKNPPIRRVFSKLTVLL